MEKDIVTRENIQKDIKDYYMQYKLKTDIVVNAFMFVAVFISLFLLLNAKESHSMILTVVFLIMLSCFVACLIRLFLNVFSLKNCLEQYTLVSDKLCGIGTDWKYIIGVGTIGYEKMFFNQYGERMMCRALRSKIYSATFYKWSLNFQMSAKRLMERSAADDQFVLVIYKNKIIMLYNLKFFKFSEDLVIME